MPTCTDHLPPAKRPNCRHLNPPKKLPRPGAYAAGLWSEEQRFDAVRHACPGAGACGGMYTANTMASSIEAMVRV
jgi:dihydroxyacid dehydratase/phosphogluconate dehydratase